MPLQGLSLESTASTTLHPAQKPPAKRKRRKSTPTVKVTKPITRDSVLEDLDAQQQVALLKIAESVQIDKDDPLWQIIAILSRNVSLQQNIPAQIRAAGADVVGEIQAAQPKTGLSRLTGLVILLAALTVAAAGAVAWLDARQHTALSASAAALAETKEGQLALQLAQHNDLEEALDACHGERLTVVSGRQACAVPLWLEGPPPPDRRWSDTALSWLRGLWAWLNTLHPLWLFGTGFLLWPVLRYGVLAIETLQRFWLFRLVFHVERPPSDD